MSERQIPLMDRYMSIARMGNLDFDPDLMLFLRQEKSIGNVIYITGLILPVAGSIAIFKPNNFKII